MQGMATLFQVIMARLISDAMINLLTILVSLFDHPLPFGMTLIEKAESASHAMIQLANTFREINSNAFNSDLPYHS